MIKRRMRGKRIKIRSKNPGGRDKKLFNKAIFIYITPEIYDLLKKRVEFRNTTIRKWVTRAVIKDLKRELEYDL